MDKRVKSSSDCIPIFLEVNIYFKKKKLNIFILNQKNFHNFFFWVLDHD